MTLGGTIIVDGVLASCYATVQYDVGHIVMTPLRWFPRMTEWILGDTTTFVNMAEDLGRLVLTKSSKNAYV